MLLTAESIPTFKYLKVLCVSFNNLLKFHQHVMSFSAKVSKHYRLMCAIHLPPPYLLGRSLDSHENTKDLCADCSQVPLITERILDTYSSPTDRIVTKQCDLCPDCNTFDCASNPMYRLVNDLWTNPAGASRFLDHTTYLNIFTC